MKMTLKNQKSNIFLSLIIPCYNGQEYISDCLDSILIQGLPTNEYEIVVVNDGSTDNSLEILNNYQWKYSNIKVISQPNGGLSNARNTGIRHAVGKYIEFIDCDDLIFSNSLIRVFKILKNELSKNEGFIDIITFGMKRISLKDGKIPVEAKEFINTNNTHSDKLTFYENGISFLESNNWNNGVWYYLIRRDFIIENNLLFEDGRLCEDGMFTLNLFLLSKKVIKTNVIVYLYIARPGSITTTRDVKKFNKLAEDFIFAINYINNLIIEYKPSLSNNCLSRIFERRDSYVFFLMARLLRAGAYKTANQRIKELKAARIYPIKYFKGESYYLSVKILIKIINCKLLFIILCSLNHLRLRIKQV